MMLNFVISSFSEVIIISDKNHSEVIAAGEFTLIKFYAPWCEACKAIAPSWENYSYESTIQVAEIDCTKYQGLC